MSRCESCYLTPGIQLMMTNLPAAVPVVPSGEGLSWTSFCARRALCTGGHLVLKTPQQNPKFMAYLRTVIHATRNFKGDGLGGQWWTPLYTMRQWRSYGWAWTGLCPPNHWLCPPNHWLCPFCAQP